MNAIAQKALGAVLDVEILAEAEERQFRGLVGRPAGAKAQGADGGDVEDGLQSSFRVQQEWEARARGEIDAVHVHGPRVPPFEGVAVGDRVQRLQVAGIVDQDIQLSEGGFDLGGRSFDALAIYYI